MEENFLEYPAGVFINKSGLIGLSKFIATNYGKNNIRSIAYHLADIR